MSSNQSDRPNQPVKENTDIDEDYLKPKCGLTRDDPFFKNRELTEVCGKGKCQAQIWCHPSAPHSLCTLSRQDILGDKAEWMTKTGLCIPCLQKKVCCLAADHPSKDSIRPPSPPSPPSPPDRLSTSSKSSTEPYKTCYSFYFIEVDGTKFDLAKPRGFRRFILNKCNEIGIVGYINRFRNKDVKVLAYGTENQFSIFENFLNDLKNQHFFIDFIQEDHPNQRLHIDSFVIIKNQMKKVKNGKYSDGLEEFDRNTVYSNDSSHLSHFST